MRLIDADALSARMYHDSFEIDSDMQKWDSGCWIRYKLFEKNLEDTPTISLHGYNIKHLELIAEILQKENLSPERVAEALSDIGRIVEMVYDEFTETLRKGLEQ